MTMRSWRRVALHAAVLCGALVFFGWVAQARVVDDDEGFYALAGRAIFEEQLLPYRDFFLPQLPVAPIVYGLFQHVFGVGLASLRWLAAVASALCAWLVFVAAHRHVGPRGGLLAAVLFSTHVLVWEWLVTVKTFPITVPLLLGALLLCTTPSDGTKRWFWAGALAGLCAASRVLAAPVIAVVVASAWLASRRADTAPGATLRRPSTLAVLGAVLGLLPAVVPLVAAPEAFWFDNVTFHGIRAGSDALVEDVPQKVETLGALLLPPLGATRPDVTGLQTVALLLLAGLACRQRRRAALPWAAAAALLSLVAVLPSPTWTQYFVLAVGPLAVLGGLALGARLSWGSAAGACLLSAAVVATTFHDRILVQPGFSRPAAFDAVGRVLDAITSPGQRVAAHWPAFIAGSARRPLPEARNQFARLYSGRLEADQLARYHLYTEMDLRQALLAGRAGAFVVGRFVEPETALAVRRAGWLRTSDLPGVTVWTPPEAAR